MQNKSIKKRRPRRPALTITCDNCGKLFNRVPRLINSTRNICSRQCLALLVVPGLKHNHLILIQEIERSPCGARRIECKCDCGRIISTPLSAFMTRTTKSCRQCVPKYTHYANTTHGQSETADYKRWSAMIARCRNTKHQVYPSYGGRGITVCERWHVFENFINDMGGCPGKGYELDRIDNDGNYCPENCRWATRTQQMRNTRTVNRITHNGETLSVADWADRFKVDHQALRYFAIVKCHPFEQSIKLANNYCPRGPIQKIVHNGHILSIRGWAKHLNVDHNRLWNLLKRKHLSIGQAIEVLRLET